MTIALNELVLLSIKVTYEADYISLLRDSTMSSALNFCFYVSYCTLKQKDHIRRKKKEIFISEISINIIITIIIIIIIIIIIVVVVVIIELTHSRTILENTVEIEPQPVALDFKNLSQYSSRSK